MSRTFRLGLFIVSTLVILGIGVFLIGDKQLLFSSTYQLKTNFKNVVGLDPGAEVLVGGVAKGSVKRIELPPTPGGDVTVVMKMEKSTRGIIRADSVASIQTEGLLGDKYVAISFGSDSAPEVQNGATIASAPPLELSDVVKKTDEVMTSLKQSTDSFKEIGEKINEGKGTMGALVNDKQVYKELNQTVEQAKLGAAAFQEDMEALKHNFFLRGFFNKRGYEDSTKLAQHEIGALPRGRNGKTFSLDPDKLFEGADSAKLKNPKLLNEAGTFLETNAFSLAVVTVESGMKGDAEQAHVLTQARAMNVRDYLVKNFKMDDTRVKTMGLGKSEQAGDTGMVELIIYPPGSTDAPATRPGGTPAKSTAASARR